MSLTPEQFDKLLTKEDLKKFATKNEFNEIFDEILTKLNKITKGLKNMSIENISNQGAHDRMQKSIDSHDKRINKLELKTA